MTTAAATRDRTAAERTRRMRERRLRGFFIVGVEVCKSDLEMLSEEGDPAHADQSTDFLCYRAIVGSI